MATLSSVRAFLHLVDAPAALCNATGVITAQNDAFVGWARAAMGERVEVHADRGILVLGDDAPRGLAMTPLTGGGWLALAGRCEAQGAVSAVCQSVARRLERVESGLEANAATGLLEHPSTVVAHVLRETLAASQELRMLRLQVEALAGPPREQRTPVCLLGLLREAVSVLPESTPVLLEESDGDYTVEVDRPRFFAHVVGLLDAFARRAAPDRPVHVSVRDGDAVRVTLSLASPAWSLAGDREIEDLRSFLAAGGGRMLLDPSGQLMLELPAFSRTAGLRTGSGAGTVLIVDDDESTLAMMRAVLHRAGFRVLTAENGVVASVLLRDNFAQIVALVADAVLPGRSGMELAEEARKYRPQVPVLLVSAHPSDLLGGDDMVDFPLLSKPFGARTLADRVRKLVALSGGEPS